MKRERIQEISLEYVEKTQNPSIIYDGIFILKYVSKPEVVQIGLAPKTVNKWTDWSKTKSPLVYANTIRNVGLTILQITTFVIYMSFA